MNMKKLVSLLAAAALVCTMSTTAFANTVNTEGGTDSAVVTATYQAGGAAATVYSVDIKWDEMSFTYTAAGQGTWNPTTHEYNGGSEASWSGSKNIVVTNHSNAAVKATASFRADSSYDAVGMNFENNITTVNSAEGTEVASAPNVTIKATPTGTLPEATNGKIGTITVTIAAAE